MPEMFYSNNDAKVYWDSANNWIYIDWQNIPSDENIKQACDAMFKMLQKKKAQKVLNDNRHIVGMWSVKAANWAEKEWFPKMIASGLKKYAWVQSSNPGSRVSAKVAGESAANKGIIQYFSDYAEAEDWLKK